MKLWIKKAIALGGVFFLAVLLVKPIGVSTQFSVLAGIFHSALDETIITENAERSAGYESSNAYYDKSGGKLAKLNSSTFFIRFPLMTTFSKVTFLTL